jgi:hypothetical protein
MPITMKHLTPAFHSFAFAFLSVIATAQEAVPPTSVALDKTIIPVFGEGALSGKVTTEDAYSNFRIFLKYDAEESSWFGLGEEHGLELPAGKGRTVEIAYEHSGASPAILRSWVDGKVLHPGNELGDTAIHISYSEDEQTSSETLRLDRDFTTMARFKLGKGSGTLFSKCLPDGEWVEGSKALFVRNGALVYSLGGKKELVGKAKMKKDQEHLVVLVSKDAEVSLFLDGERIANQKNFVSNDTENAVFQSGAGAKNYGGQFTGDLKFVRYWKRALEADEVKNLSSGKEDTVNTPDLNRLFEKGETSFGGVPGHALRPVIHLGGGFVMHRAFVQPLEKADHAALVGKWNEESFHRGREIYSQLCMTCHGTLEEAGSLPTAPRFHLDGFKNGADPYRMFQTLEKGYGLMTPMPQYTSAQKYDVIYYLREQFLKGKNEKNLVPVDEEYLSLLPRGMSAQEENPAARKQPQFLLQDYGDTLFWTLQVEPGNIAQKGIAIRMDEGAGGISKGKAWMLYDHDTMRLAACWTGEDFIDWKGIAFDGSHGTHTSIVGEKHFISPDQPVWANPATGDYKDLRILGRDGRPYGPLPREWVHFKGVEIHGGKPVIRYTVGDCEIREVPRLASDGSFERLLIFGPSEMSLKLKLDDVREETCKPGKTGTQLLIRYRDGKVEVTSAATETAPEKPVSKRYGKMLTTTIGRGEEKGAWAVDVLKTPEPDQNPWQSWMRTSGFDFFEGGKSAAVCTWDGEVWIVDGIDQSEGELKWQLICSGLFQPLGLKIVNGEIYVGCRDMIAVLRDFNGDRETDFIESFNSDHQVTEHFHEFAMGLQTDAEGNFYYAKSARHAKTPVVPHHGTLLKVSKDGRSTEVIATGFRAANGVCLNPDGSYMVTDQEGHWNPKNRVNWVFGDRKGSENFYGNMWGYHDITDTSDAAMTQPLCWITNSYDRSPAELLWVPEEAAWKTLRGSLLNLSYGAGQIYTVPFEKTSKGVQGGMSALPTGLFPTGIMRGRFSPHDGQLYACGMYSWAGNRQEPGGFFRVRYTGKPAHQPIQLTTSPGTVTIGFSDALNSDSVADLSAWKIRAWDIKRTEKYGSQHFNEREWKPTKAILSDDKKSVTLSVPDLAPTWGMSIEMKLRGENGEDFSREIHNSIFDLE